MFWEQSAKLRQEEKALIDATQTTVTSSDHQKQNEDTAQVASRYLPRKDSGKRATNAAPVNPQEEGLVHRDEMKFRERVIRSSKEEKRSGEVAMPPAAPSGVRKTRGAGDEECGEP